jgi:hypothetical protein
MRFNTQDFAISCGAVAHDPSSWRLSSTAQLIEGYFPMDKHTRHFTTT